MQATMIPVRCCELDHAKKARRSRPRRWDVGIFAQSPVKAIVTLARAMGRRSPSGPERRSIADDNDAGEVLHRARRLIAAGQELMSPLGDL
jgi:hypothetical protein